jgi:hypothetical protein
MSILEQQQVSWEDDISVAGREFLPIFVLLRRNQYVFYARGRVAVQVKFRC